MAQRSTKYIQIQTSNKKKFPNFFEQLIVSQYEIYFETLIMFPSTSPRFI